MTFYIINRYVSFYFHLIEPIFMPQSPRPPMPTIALTSSSLFHFFPHSEIPPINHEKKDERGSQVYLLLQQLLPSFSVRDMLG